MPGNVWNQILNPLPPSQGPGGRPAPNRGVSEAELFSGVRGGTPSLDQIMPAHIDAAGDLWNRMSHSPQGQQEDHYQGGDEIDMSMIEDLPSGSFADDYDDRGNLVRQASPSRRGGGGGGGGGGGAGMSRSGEREGDVVSRMVGDADQGQGDYDPLTEADREGGGVVYVGNKKELNQRRQKSDGTIAMPAIIVDQYGGRHIFNPHSKECQKMLKGVKIRLPGQRGHAEDYEADLPESELKTDSGSRFTRLRKFRPES